MARPPQRPRAQSTQKASTPRKKRKRTTPSESPIQATLLDEALSLSDDLQDEGSVRALKAISGEPINADSDIVLIHTDLPVAAEAEVFPNDGDLRSGTKALTDVERARLAELEREVRESFYRAGCALREIRDSRLYRETHKTFEEYCLDALGYKRAYSYELLDAATTFDNIHKCLRPADILPTSAYQIRPLKKLKDDPEKQAAAWRQAVKKSEGKQPTYEAVKEVVAELIFPAQTPRTQRTRPQQEQWKHAPTKMIRVPEKFADELLKIAHFLDNGGRLSEVNDLENL